MTKLDPPWTFETLSEFLGKECPDGISIFWPRGSDGVIAWGAGLDTVAECPPEGATGVILVFKGTTEECYEKNPRLQLIGVVLADAGVCPTVLVQVDRGVDPPWASQILRCPACLEKARMDRLLEVSRN